jgi:predicted phosphate transport protein (TIGR00153 family)
MVFDFSTSKNSKAMKNHLFTVIKLKNEANEQKRVLLNELALSGSLLVSREDILRLVVQVNEIADYSEGAAFRINHITDKKLKVNEEVKSHLFNMAKNVLKTVTTLRETLLSLSYSRTRAIEMAKNVEAAEYAVDELYRETEMKIIDSKMNIRTIMLLRDTAQFLEDIADKAEDAIDSTRILALGI